MKQKLTKRLLYWQKLSDLLMLLHFVTRFIRTSTVHNTTQSSFTQSLSKWKTKCYRGPTPRYGMRLQAVMQQSRKTIIDQRIAARQTCCYTGINQRLDWRLVPFWWWNVILKIGEQWPKFSAVTSFWQASLPLRVTLAAHLVFLILSRQVKGSRRIAKALVE